MFTFSMFSTSPVSARRLLLAGLIAAALLPAAATAQDGAQGMATLGGAPVLASDDMMSNLSHSLDHTILTQAFTATGLDDTLAGPGPYTLFAPTDAAFGKLDKDKLAALLAPEHKTELMQLLNYHIVRGRLTSADIEKQVNASNGRAILGTVEGDPLTVERKDGQYWLEDSSHNRAAIQQSDVMQSNGVLFVIDTVMQPKA